MENITRFVLITGDEEYLKNEKKKELLSQLSCEGSPDFHVFSEKDTDFNEVLDLAETMPMFSSKRVILLEGTGLFKGSADPQLLARLKELPETTCMIFYESETDERNALCKLIKTDGLLYRFQQADSQKDWKAANSSRSEIRNWIRDSIKAGGKKIDSGAVEALVDLAGYQMLNLKTELDKLLSCPCDVITRDLVNTLCSRNIPDRVFDMMDMKLAGNTAGALRLFEDMLSIRVEPLRILYMLVRQFQQVLMIKDLTSQKRSDAEIMSAVSLKDWQLRKLREKSRGTSYDDMLYLLRLGAELETKVKTGDLPDRLAVEILLCS